MKTKWKEEYQKANGLEMNLFVDLMIANKNDKKVVIKKLNELIAFFTHILSDQRKEIVRELEEMKNHKPYFNTTDKALKEFWNEALTQAIERIKKEYEKANATLSY